MKRKALQVITDILSQIFVKSCKQEDKNCKCNHKIDSHIQMKNKIIIERKLTKDKLLTLLTIKLFYLWAKFTKS